VTDGESFITSAATDHNSKHCSSSDTEHCRRITNTGTSLQQCWSSSSDCDITLHYTKNYLLLLLLLLCSFNVPRVGHKDNESPAAQVKKLQNPLWQKNYCRISEHMNAERLQFNGSFYVCPMKKYPLSSKPRPTDSYTCTEKVISRCKDTSATSRCQCVCVCLLVMSCAKQMNRLRCHLAFSLTGPNEPLSHR